MGADTTILILILIFYYFLFFNFLFIILYLFLKLLKLAPTASFINDSLIVLLQVHFIWNLTLLSRLGFVPLSMSFPCIVYGASTRVLLQTTWTC